MINRPATRLVAAILVVGGLAAAPLLDDNQPDYPPLTDRVMPETPRFTIAYRRGELRLAGHTLSAEHESNLLQVANSSFNGKPVSVEFVPASLAPQYWNDLTTQLVYLLAESVSATAELTEGRVAVRSVTSNALGWQNRVTALRQVLPDDVVLDEQSQLLDNRVSARYACESATAGFEAGPINFAEATDRFRNSATPRMDRIITLARLCENFDIEIVGHTDSSGDETWNLQLSELRAIAVANYIAAGGISSDRLRTIGAGSSLAIANNETRYGRSQNRRIEIRFLARD